MAGNNSIQFVRGTSSKRASHTETSLAGQPIYETDTNRLYVGDGETSVNDLTAVEASAADIAENVKDQNNGAGIKIWIGTQAEFEDLSETDEDTIYYITDIVSLLELDEEVTTLKQQLLSGDFKVGKAGAADSATKATQDASGNVITSTYATRNELTSGLSGKANTSGSYPNLTVGKATNADNATNATHADDADEATNVTTSINDKAISSIFETDGTTAKEATHAISADVATNVMGKIDGHSITSIFEDNGTTVKKATYAESANEAAKAYRNRYDELLLSCNPTKLTPSTANGWTQTTTTGTLPSAGVYLVSATIDDGGNSLTVSPCIMVFDGTNSVAALSVAVAFAVFVFYQTQGSTRWFVSLVSNDTNQSITNVYYKRIDKE